MKHPTSLPAAALALALGAALATPTSAQSPQPTLYIDVATHAMPSMPGMGALGRLAGTMGGSGQASYGQARHPGMPGRYLDVALLNPRQPGSPARQAVPAGLRVEDAIDLLPQARQQPAPRDTDNDHIGIADGTSGRMTIRYYWGCGEQARAGQPREYTVSYANGKFKESGRGLEPRQVPETGAKVDARHALWPNPNSRKAVPAKASLVGTHQLSGQGLEALRFELGAEHDFLPELQLTSEKAGDGTVLRWNEVQGARAYFIHAMASGEGDTMVMWSSSEDGYAGPELFDYLPEKKVGEWLGKRTLLPAAARDCRIPREVLAAGEPMLQMIAYGNDRTLRQSGLNVHVRTKSTAMLMPGMSSSARDAAKPAAREGAKSLLRGLIGR